MPHTCDDCGEEFETLNRSRVLPDSSDHWDWETLYPEFHADGFDWDPDVRDRLRDVVVDCGLARQLPDDWDFTDIVL